MTTSDLTDQRIDELAASTSSPDTYRALQELKRRRTIMARLEVWIAARDRFTDDRDRDLILEVIHDLDRRVLQAQTDGYPQDRDIKRE